MYFFPTKTYFAQISEYFMECILMFFGFFVQHKYFLYNLSLIIPGFLLILWICFKKFLHLEKPKY